MNTVYVFIDSSNIWPAQKAKGRLLNLEETRNYIKDKFSADAIKVFYYAAYPANGTRSYDLSGKHDFFVFLNKGLKFEVRKKELKRIFIVTEHGQAIKEKGNMDVEITIDAMYHINNYDTAIFFSGDSDFLPLISHLKNVGKKVYIFSSKNNISEELKTGGDGYNDILEIEGIWRDQLRHRNK